MLFSVIAVMTWLSGIVVLCLGHNITGVILLVVGSYLSGMDVTRRETELLRSEIKFLRAVKPDPLLIALEAEMRRSDGKSPRDEHNVLFFDRWN